MILTVVCDCMGDTMYTCQPCFVRHSHILLHPTNTPTPHKHPHISTSTPHHQPPLTKVLHRFAQLGGLRAMQALHAQHQRSPSPATPITTPLQAPGAKMARHGSLTAPVSVHVLAASDARGMGNMLFLGFCLFSGGYTPTCHHCILCTFTLHTYFSAYLFLCILISLHTILLNTTGSFVFVDPLLYDQQAAMRAVQAFLKARNHSSEEDKVVSGSPLLSQPSLMGPARTAPPIATRSSLTMEGVEAVRKVLVSALFPSEVGKKQ